MSSREGITIAITTRDTSSKDIDETGGRHCRLDDSISHCSDQQDSQFLCEERGDDGSLLKKQNSLELEDDQGEMKIVPPPACWYQTANTSSPSKSITNDLNADNCDANEPPIKQIPNENDTHINDQLSLPVTSNCCDEMTLKDCISASLSLGTGTDSNSARVLSSPNRSHISRSQKSISSAIVQNISALKTITTTVLPPLAQELVSASALKAYHYTRISYSNSKLFGKHYLQNSEVGNRLGGYDRRTIRELGIRDERSGKLIWREGMILDENGGLVQNQIASDDDSCSCSEQQLVCRQEDDVDTWDEGTEDALVRTVDKDKVSMAGQGWEDEWDRNRLSLPAFSSLPWVDRQLVKEWRTCDYLTNNDPGGEIPSQDDCENDAETEETKSQRDDLQEEDFEQARTLLPQPIQKPPWENASSCYACRRFFGATLRHHCRLCGRSYCQAHSRWAHKLPHLGYSPDVPERVCAPCKQVLESQNLAERIAWRMARCRDFLARDGSNLCPYFETGVDTVEDAAARLTKAAIHMAKSIPLGAQATMTVETLDVLRKHGLKGVYGLILRKEFLAAADLLCKVTGINKKVWPLSVHELSAAIFYALAQHRALRGLDPEREHRIHALKEPGGCKGVDAEHVISLKHRKKSSEEFHQACESGEAPKEEKIECKNLLVDETDDYDPTIETTELEQPILSNKEEMPAATNIQVDDGDETYNDGCQHNLPFDPVCDSVSDGLLSSLIFYAPLALNFIYATSEVDMQILAAQQGWRLLYAHLSQDDGTWGGQVADKPASALFLNLEQKIACFAIRGTATINDVVTDIRAVPVQFPDSEMDGVHRIQCRSDMDEEGWTPVSKGQGLALCGMAGAACNLFRENIDSILLLARQGYRIRLTGHSLGGSVAALLGALIKRHFEFHLPQSMSEDEETLRVYSYGSPACVDAKLSDHAQSYVTNCVLHDDVIPRLTPTSIRALLKHLLYIRETWVKAHLSDDLMAITERAKTAWAPKLRNGFSLINTGNPSVKVYKKLKAKGKTIRQKIKKGGKKLKAIASNKKGVKTVAAEDIYEEELNVDYRTTSHVDDEDDHDNGDETDPTLFFEGDCFYEAEESLIEYSDEESVGEDSKTNSSCDKLLESWVPFDEVPFDEPPPNNDEERGKKMEDNTNPIVLEETPLPRMFIPGKIVHIYTHRGAYKAALVPKAFRELRRISLAGSMLNDHMSKHYYEALLECKSVRAAKRNLPEWTGFSEEMTCCCCASRFTWASTSGSDAQEARDRHNCRACGGLVCAPCSSNRVPIPDVGINVASRLCDRCYHDMGSVLSDKNVLARSFTAGEKEDERYSNLPEGDQFVLNKRNSKRSALVDELVMRMPSATVSG